MSVPAFIPFFIILVAVLIVFYWWMWSAFLWVNKHIDIWLRRKFGLEPRSEESYKRWWSPFP